MKEFEVQEVIQEQDNWQKEGKRTTDCCMDKKTENQKDAAEHVRRIFIHI